MSKSRNLGKKDEISEPAHFSGPQESFMDFMDKKLSDQDASEFSLSQATSKSDLYDYIKTTLKTLIHFTEAAIVFIDEGHKTHSNYLYYSDQGREQSEAFSLIMERNYPLSDGFMDIALEAEKPLRWLLREVVAWKVVPEYIKYLAADHIRTVVGIVLKDNSSKIGCLFFLSENEQGFSVSELLIIERIGTQISEALVGILAYENQLGKQKEKEMLLFLSTEIASIRDREGLGRVIGEHLKKAVLFNNMAIITVNRDKLTQRIFIDHFEDIKDLTPEYKAIRERGSCNVTDGIVDTVLKAKKPLVWNLDEVLKWDNVPIYVSFWAQRGVKRLVGVPVHNNKKAIGCIFFYSDKENAFPTKQLDQIYDIANQLSIAILNIIANEEIEKREVETKLLLSLSNQLSLVKDKKQLADIIDKHLKKVLVFSNFEIAYINEEKNVHGTYLSHESEGESFFPDFLSLSNLIFPLNDGFFDTLLNLKSATVVSIEKLLDLDNVPVYMSIWKKAGIKEVAIMPIYQGGKVCDVLFLMSKTVNAFSFQHFNLIHGISHQLSTSLTNLRSIDQIRQKDYEQEILLSLSNDIAAIRNKKALLNVLHEKLQVLFPFNDMLITCVDQDKNFHYCFIYNYERKRMAHPLYELLISARYPVNDGVIDVVMEADEPVVFSVDELVQRDEPEEYFKYYQTTGLRELVGVAMRNGKEDIGGFFLTSERAGTYNEQHLSLIKGVSSQLCIAVANILANDNIVEREKEKSVLLKLGNSIATIRNKSQLLKFLQEKVKKLVPFSAILITLSNYQEKAQNVFLTMTEENRIANADFDKESNLNPAFGNEVINQIVKSDDPVIFDLDELVEFEYVPTAVTLYSQLGIKEFTGISLRTGERVIGTLYLLSEEKNTYQIKNFNLIRGIADQLSFSIINILANNDLLRKEEEKSTLLAISNDLATIRNKGDLLRILHERLSKIFYFSYTVIALSNPSKGTYAGYIFDPHSKTRSHPEYGKMHKADYPLDDSLMKIILSANGPAIFDMQDLMQKKDIPDYIRIQYESGMKEIVYSALNSGNKPLGFLMILSDKKRGFKTDQLNLIQGISYQLSNAVANILANEEILQREDEKSLLLAMGNNIATIRNKVDLNRVVSEKLKKLMPISHVLTCVISEDGQWYHPYITDTDSKCKNHPDYVSVITSKCLVHDGITDLVLSSEYPVIFNLQDLIKRPELPRYLRMNYECGIREVVFSALSNGKKKTGIFVLFLNSENNLSSNNLSLIQGISAQLSTAISNILANEEIIERENEKSLLLSFSNDIAGVRDKAGLTKVISKGLSDFFNIHEYLVTVVNEDEITHSYFLYDLSAPFVNNAAFQKIKSSDFTIGGGMAEMVFKSETPVHFDMEQAFRNGDIKSAAIPFWLSVGVNQCVGIALRVGNKNIGILWTFADRINDGLMKAVSSQIAIALANTVANEKIEKQVIEISNFKQQLEVENLYLQEEIQTSHNYSEIIGTSTAMQKVFEMVSQVSETQSSVLLLGETGTGKELIARAIHNTSLRKDKLMVKVNCATLPANLIESELFGHEKGSFTGATERRIGKFELANHGTLFLDEIGEMPLDLQVKLLRALQEKEIERVGGRSVIKTDVRVIAATNRNLQKEVQLGNFRSDLFFRLNVFPIIIPPLRERKEDIPTLASHFLEKHAKKGGKKILGFSSKAIKQLTAYNWPGNVRELEHLIERSILLTSQPLINQVHLPVADSEEIDVIQPGARIKTIDEVEREHIMMVLKTCNWRVAGVGGAAEILMIPPTTLNSKIKRLGIKKEYVTN